MTGTDEVLEVWCSITPVHRAPAPLGGYCASPAASCPPETRMAEKGGLHLGQTARTPVLTAVSDKLRDREQATELTHRVKLRTVLSSPGYWENDWEATWEKHCTN